MKAEYLQHKDGTRFVPITQPDAVINSEGKSLTSTLAAMEEEIKSKGTGSGKVDDVKVDGTSVVTDKVANIDLSGKVDTTDSRLSDARTPLAHTHAISEVTNLQSSLDALSEADSQISQNLNGKLSIPDSKTEYPSDGNVASNTIYNLGEITSLTIANASSVTTETLIYFSVGSTACEVAITKPYDIVGSIDTSASGDYVISIANGVIVCGTITNVTE